MKKTDFKYFKASLVKLIQINTTVVFFVIISLSLFSSNLSISQYLRADGKKIVDGNNEEIILRGIGLGGWMLQEGYMLRISGPQHEIESRIEDLIGEEKKQEFYDVWLTNHFRKIDVDSMAAWGFNSIRLPMHYKLFTPPIEEEPVTGEITWLEKGFAMVDSLLDWVEENNMYLILDLHAAPGGQGENADISDYDPSKPSLWESQANQEKTVALWKKLAERYANEPAIGAYDIINEPNWGFQNHGSDPNGCSESHNAPLWSLEKKITEVIREVDTNHLIIIEGNCWGNNYSGLPALWDDNLVISYHKYWNSNGQGSIQGMLSMRDDRNVPIWLGESGENSNTWFTDAIELLENNEIGWSWWPFKKMGRNNPMEIKVDAGYQEILDYWSGSSGKPSQEDAYQSLMQLTENLKLENNTFHKDVVDAMIRQPHSDEALPFDSNTISPTSTSRLFAVNYDLGRHDIAYHDDEVTNETGNAGGLTWNQGYSYRNDGVDIQNCEDAISNGFNVGWTADGEWLQYTLNVDSTGAYQIDLRYAAPGEGSVVKILVEGSDKTGTISLPSTGGYQTWQTFTLYDVILKKGKQVLKFYIEKGGLNFNYLEFILKKKTSEVIFKAVSGETGEENNVIFLTLNKDVDATTLEKLGFSCQVNDNEFAATDATADPKDASKLILEFATDLIDATSIKLSYGGNQVSATDGTVLEPFSDLEIESNFPFHHPLPGKIEAEDFSANYGLQLETTTDTGGGQNVGYTNAGDYLDYLINVEQEGVFNIEVRIACESNSGVFEFQQLNKDGVLLQSKQVEVPLTGGWQTWETITVRMRLNVGRTRLRVLIEDPEFNINWYNFTWIGVVTGVEEEQQGSILIYPNPASDQLHFQLPGKKPASEINTVSVWNDNGILIHHSKNNLDNQGRGEIEIGKWPPGFYLFEWQTGKETLFEKFIIR